MRTRNTKTIRILVSVIALFVALIIGFALRGNSALLDAVGFPQSMTGIAKDDTDANSGTKDAYNSLSARISEVEEGVVVAAEVQ